MAAASSSGMFEYWLPEKTTSRVGLVSRMIPRTRALRSSTSSRVIPNGSLMISNRSFSDLPWNRSATWTQMLSKRARTAGLL